MLLAILFAVLIISTPIVIFMSCIFDTANPKSWFSGCMTNKEFGAMMSLMEKDPKLSYSHYTIEGAGYSCWVCNGYFWFKVNDIEDFTPYQKIWFYYRFRNLMKPVTEKPKYAEKLHLAKINEELFTRELDSKLEHEDKV